MIRKAINKIKQFYLFLRYSYTTPWKSCTRKEKVAKVILKIIKWAAILFLIYCAFIIIFVVLVAFGMLTGASNSSSRKRVYYDSCYDRFYTD